MPAKLNLSIILLLLVTFTGLIDVSHQPLFKSIAVDLNQSVLGTMDAAPSQVGEIKIGEQQAAPTPTPKKETPQVKARKINDNTWTVDVPSDSRSATQQEVFAALNAYRQKKGQALLSWDDKLANYAQERATGFSTKNALDGHAGFLDFVNNQDGFRKLSFSKLGENSAIGYINSGTSLIEQVYGGSALHDANQLESKWSHVGIGVSGTASNLIFGGGRL